jgi:multicomponent K+:H+ antiporter subunit A
MAAMPVVGSLVLVASAAMAGLPPFNGFISKEMMLHEALHAGDGGFWGGAPWVSWVVGLLATLGGLCSAAYSLRLVHDTFFGRPGGAWPHPQPHEPPWGMKAPVLVFVALCIAVGLAPMTVAGPLVASVATVVLGAPAPAFELALWHGLNLPLALSAVALGGGAWLYLGVRRGGALHRYQPRAWSGKAASTAVIDGLFGTAGRITAALENGSLQRYVACMVASVIVLAAWPFLTGPGALPQAGARALLPASALAVAVWALLLVTGAAVVVLHRQRFTATVLLGAVGLVASLTFVALSAPDLALTQLSVDVVSTALLLMGLALLPQVSPVESRIGRRGRDALLALAGGGGIAWLTWLMLTSDHDSISWYFLQQSVPAGGGANSVNVILVDFRGYDTFGEITVLGIAAVGVLALLDGMRVRRPERDADGRAWSFAREPLMLRVGARLVLPMALVATAYIFWRGHGLPGGGFIAGLVTAVALVLQYMAVGQARAEAVLRAGGGRRFTRWIGVGLAIAGATGAGAFLFGRPFLTSAHGHPVLPLLGEVPLATAALFDLGVYVTVVGATMLMLSVLGAASKEPSRGTARAGGPGAAAVSKGSR